MGTISGFNVIRGGARSGFTSQRQADLRSVLQSLPEAVFLFDSQARIVDLNSAAEHVAGKSRRELLGVPADSLAKRFVPQSGRSPEDSMFVRSALRGESVRHARCLLQSGSGRPGAEVVISANPMCDPVGRIAGALIVIQDVSEISKLQREIASKERQSTVGQMTAGMAHDFNNVLNSISESVFMLMGDSERSEHDLTVLNMISGAVRRGSEIVANIRAHVRGERQSRTKVAMQDLLEDVVELVRPMLKNHPHVRLRSELNDCPPVLANASELRRAFNNLAINSLEAMPEGGTLHIACHRENESVVVSIADTGLGIPIGKQKLIFTPYFTTKSKGTGLGLSGARQAIEMHGGRIRFESKPGKGTTFYVRLPIEKAASGAA